MNSDLHRVSNHSHSTMNAVTRALIAAAAACVAGAVRADEPNPYYIGLSETLAHDSNIYRIPGGPGDSYSSTALLGGFDQSISRQRLYA